ncbi:MAG: hypothetical protein EOO92_18755, partial [Pedobacter sp.]
MKTTIAHFSKLTLMTVLGSTLFFTSCKKDEENQPEILTPVEQQPDKAMGVYILSEGVFNTSTLVSNSSISYYDIETGKTESEYYQKVNGTSLGVNANDLKAYGHKIYCVVTGTDAGKNSYVDVIDQSTGKSLKRVNFYDGEKSFLPRSIAFNKNKAYVSNYDGTVLRLDTASLAIDGTVMLSKGLEHIVVSNSKLYVANSAHFMYPGKGNVVSVIDINTFKKVRDIEVAVNPYSLAVTQAGDVLVSSIGTYMSEQPYSFNNDAVVSRINSVTDTKVATYKYNNGEAVTGIASVNGNSYIYSSSYLKHYSISDGTLGSNFAVNGVSLTTPYGLTVEPLSNDVYV